MAAQIAPGKTLRMSAQKVPRVAIVGGGIAGLTLAGILTKKLGQRVQIDILERGAANQDQGYGLDLDMHGQKALALAGVYHRYWEISRPHSDVMKFYPLRGSKPAFVLSRPKALQKMFPSKFGAQPESNRAGIRKVLLEEMEVRGSVSMRYNCCPAGIREVRMAEAAYPHGSMAELFDTEGSSLGRFDLVVDASGVHSSLRHHHITDAQGKHYTGRMTIHGVINDPDSKAPKELADRLGQGSLVVLGRGYMLCLQRFGAEPEDHRTAFFYSVQRANEDELLKEIGLQKVTSRQEGIRTDAESLEKARAWLHRDMSNHFEHLYHEAVDCLDCITVRGEHSHGDTRLKPVSSLPLICIGDALRNIGLGGGGNLAMQDSMELAEALCREGTFDSATGHVDMEVLRTAEVKMLERKVAFHKENAEKMAMVHVARAAEDEDHNLSVSDIVGGSRMMGAAATFFAHVCRVAHRWEQWRGKAGSGLSSRIYPQVAASAGEALAR